jgi:hypothetical protein
MFKMCDDRAMSSTLAAQDYPATLIKTAFGEHGFDSFAAIPLSNTDVVVDVCN